MSEVEVEAWKAFVLVVKNFLANNKAELVNNMLTAFRNLGCNMSVKMHNLFSHMDRFPEKLEIPIIDGIHGFWLKRNSLPSTTDWLSKLTDAYRKQTYPNRRAK